MKKIMFNDKYGLTEAVIRGRKTMTRRIIPSIEVDWNRRGKVQLSVLGFEDGVLLMDTRPILGSAEKYAAPKKYQPKYKVGEIVAVAQCYEDAWKIYQQRWESSKDSSNWRTPDAMLGDTVQETKGWRNKMFVKAELMPYRIRITDIKVERLQDIRGYECIQEGIERVQCSSGYRWYSQEPIVIQYDYRVPKTRNIHCFVKDAFEDLIEGINGKGTWDRNPYVFANTFELIQF